MGTLVVNNFPDDLDERLRQLAKRNHRSVADEVIQLIESGLSDLSDTAYRSSPAVIKGPSPLSVKELVSCNIDSLYNNYIYIFMNALILCHAVAPRQPSN
jgi:plasmid stability protein